jgi:N-acetylglucosamine-6-phosphate deacetylase
MKSIKNAKVYMEGRGFISTSLSFDERIQEIGASIGEEIVIPKDAIVLPGFIDQHIHGAGGYDFMDGSVLGLETISATLVKEGTVGYLATTVSASVEKTKQALYSVREYKAMRKSCGAEILGVHLEGPFICHKYKGGMNELYILQSDVNILQDFIQASENCVKIVTYAPELDSDGTFLKALMDSDIVASAGHSNATYAQMQEAVAHGLKNVTHTYNAQSPLHHREIGVVGSALLLDELHTELIADEIHVSVPAMQVLLKNKPKNKVILVTDSMRAKGVEEGISEIGGQKVIVKNGEARLENGTLAGSVLKMNIAIKNLVEDLGVSLTDAIDYATINPAKALGVEKDLGSIAVGKKASFTVLDKKYNVVMTIVNGNIVYKKED